MIHFAENEPDKLDMNTVMQYYFFNIQNHFSQARRESLTCNTDVYFGKSNTIYRYVIFVSQTLYMCLRRRNGNQSKIF